MNYTAEMYSKASGACLGVLDIDPRDYLEYPSMEEAEHAILSSLPCPEFPELDSDEDYNISSSDDVDIDIPDEFWRNWEELKEAK